MWTPTSPTRSLPAVATVALALVIGLGAPTASAKPQLETGPASTCTAGRDGLAATLRAAGLSAQAANNATQVTYRDCLWTSH